MKSNAIFISPASVTIELENANCYFSGKTIDVYLNGVKCLENVDTNVFSVYGLKSATTYKVTYSDEEIEPVVFTTDKVKFISNVKDFGAKGDGISNDTLAIQAAIFASGDDSMVVVPKGTYYITSIFLKSNMTLYLDEGAVLLANTKREEYAIFPRHLEYNGEEKVIGTWEGNPAEMFTTPVTVINCQNVKIVGLGTINGNARNSDWWVNPKVKRIAYRPRGLFISHSENVGLQGFTITNTASWTLHPYFSNNLDIIDLKIKNPADSPNTDGCDPESCSNVNIIGIKFSVGDDCIAIKSGKIYMANNHDTPCKNLTVRNCYMFRGHGALVIGSEMSSGVYNLHVSNCIFEGTDRGLRIKTRRGRGKKAVIDNVVFDNIDMKEVLNPFVLNMYYYCDPDGKSIYVSSKDPLPIDERTPHLGKFHFKNLRCKDTLVSAGFFYGLAESPIEEVHLENIDMNFVENDIYSQPAMMDGFDPVNRFGFYFNHVKNVIVENVNVSGVVGENYIFNNVNNVSKK